MTDKNLTIFEVTELNERMKFLDLAKAYAPVGKEKLREALKSAGATFDQRTKRWHIDRSHPNADKKVLDFVQSTRIRPPTPKKIATEPLTVDPVTGQSRLDDDYFEIETRPGRVDRKKVSLDMDAMLHKRLKKMAVEHEMSLYLLIENILADHIKRQK
ncbi:hypothetical protein EXIGUO8H_120004 [Exiguobacterium sp. 8H]|uniref:hypothetical protein n=1 Tax=unclassified Exiguobacterium TaxID=2644629 RepID=UPI0012F2BC49|nr:MULTISPECIES: hypothetical protein [unclassified Exiguobacterium]VXB37901.1 hypothetical protein EXIGUO8H_120004 [Exiguobacterium sp. 8H]VXB99637.1 conserved hypothetical protein [Exiguobacterium sp. 8A]